MQVRDAVNACNANKTCMGVETFNVTKHSNTTNSTEVVVRAMFSKQYAVHPAGKISPAPAPGRFQDDVSVTDTDTDTDHNNNAEIISSFSFSPFRDPSVPHRPDSMMRFRNEGLDFGGNGGGATADLSRTITTYLRAPNMSLFEECMMMQTTEYLADAFDGPFEDTIFENLYGEFLSSSFCSVLLNAAQIAHTATRTTTTSTVRATAKQHMLPK